MSLAVIQSSRPPLVDRLTHRERDVLALVATGRSNRSIAELLFVSERTIETHVARIYRKLGLPVATAHDRRVLAVLWWRDASPEDVRSDVAHDRPDRARLAG